MKVKIYHNKNFLNGRKIQLQQEEIHIGVSGGER